MNLIQIPPINKIETPTPFEYDYYSTGNGIELYSIPSSHSLELVKIEVVLNKGRYDEEKRLSSRFCARMLKEGSENHSSDAINDFFDYYGADFQVRYHLDYASFSLMCIKKYMRKLIPLFFEIIGAPSFNAEELELLKKRAKSKLKLATADNDALSFRIITEKIFGNDHPYGYNSTEDDITAITIDDLYQFHKRNYRSSFFKAYISGSIDGDIISMVEEYLYKIPNPVNANEQSIPEVSAEPPNEFYMKNNYAFNAQSSIKIGKRIIKRDHDEYLGVHFLNTLLGGFFGSRLMQNIREKEGLTYNIYSDLEPMKYDAYFIIGTDIKTENIKKVLELIYGEIYKLQSTLVGREEIRMVRNYIKGYLLSYLDGVFSKAEIVKILTIEGMDVKWVFDFFEKIDQVKSEDIMELAKKYLKKEQLFTVVVN